MRNIRRGTLLPGGARLWINAGIFALAALGMIAALTLAVRTVALERNQRETVERTTETIAQLSGLRTDLLDAETGQRGYMLSLDERYLQPYEDARRTIDASLAALRQSIAEDETPRQRILLDRIAVLARAKMADLDKGVALSRAGDRNEALRELLGNAGQQEMEELRALIRQVGDLENDQLAVATRDAERAEGRIVPLLVTVFALLAVALVAAVRVLSRSVAAEAEAAQAPILEAARDRADTLAHELNHRVKNLFAVVLAIVKLTARGAPEAKPVIDRISERIYALLKAHDATQGEIGTRTIALGKLVETTLAPYMSEDFIADIDGQEVVLDSGRITPLGLMLHELTTNAVKYGAWSQPGGTIAVRWTIEDATVRLVWKERGVAIAEPGNRKGFGSALIESSARQLSGTVERSFAEEGVTVEMAFPLD